MYPVLRALIEMYQLEDLLPLQVRALLAMFRVLDLLCIFAAAAGEGSRDVLANAITTCFRLQKLAYPDYILAWKWHAMLHLPEPMYNRGRAPSTFALERQHKVLLKEFGEQVTNLQHFEKTMTVRMLNHQIDTFDESNGNFFQTPYQTGE